MVYFLDELDGSLLVYLIEQVNVFLADAGGHIDLFLWAIPSDDKVTDSEHPLDGPLLVRVNHWWPPYTKESKEKQHRSLGVE